MSSISPFYLFHTFKVEPPTYATPINSPPTSTSFKSVAAESAESSKSDVNADVSMDCGVRVEILSDVDMDIASNCSSFEEDSEEEIDELISSSDEFDYEDKAQKDLDHSMDSSCYTKAECCYKDIAVQVELAASSFNLLERPTDRPLLKSRISIPSLSSKTLPDEDFDLYPAVSSAVSASTRVSAEGNLSFIPAKLRRVHPHHLSSTSNTPLPWSGGRPLSPPDLNKICVLNLETCSERSRDRLARPEPDSGCSASSNASPANSRPQRKPVRKREPHAGRKGNSVVSCPDCNEQFTRYADLTRHNKAKHEKKGEPCSRCGKNLSRLDALHRHMRTCAPKVGKEKTRSRKFVYMSDIESD